MALDQGEPTSTPISDQEVREIKSLRKDTDAIIQRIKALPGSAECTLAFRKAQESVMWLGMELKRRNEANPYPNSKDPSNSVIDPTADNLKL